MVERYPDPGGNTAKEWRKQFWPPDGIWSGFEVKLNRVAASQLFGDDDLFRFMVNDARSNIENGCNWPAALALLCFTEACGKYFLKTRLGKRKPSPGESFTAFIETCMRCSEAGRLAGELYAAVRCDLAHNFFLLKEDHRLEVSLGAGSDQQEKNGYQVVEEAGGQVWHFACMPYFRRFVEGLETLASTRREGTTTAKAIPQRRSANGPSRT